MWHKSFKSDKNEILRTVQYQEKDFLMRQTISIAIQNFLKIENPLAIEDDFVLKLKNNKTWNTTFLNEFYRQIADSFRYSRSDNQLEFIWDGTQHADLYKLEWNKYYRQLINDLAYHPFFNRLIIKITILDTNKNEILLKNLLIKIIKSYLGIKAITPQISKTA